MFGIFTTHAAGGGRVRTCLVRSGSRPYLIPLHTLVECIDLPRDAAGGYRELPGLPLIRLDGLFAAAGPAPGRTVVVVCCGRQQAGLLVDALAGENLGEIAPTCPLCRQWRGIAGYAVLESGEVAPILDLPELIRQAAERAAPAEALLAAA